MDRLEELRGKYRRMTYKDIIGGLLLVVFYLSVLINGLFLFIGKKGLWPRHVRGGGGYIILTGDPARIAGTISLTICLILLIPVIIFFKNKSSQGKSNKKEPKLPK